ncbi:alpha-ketoglutarate-dependent dioxygenase AlkB [uncultured Chryseobacterium sp.]|uniref:alpha-ketoglutarate-dependent dioxygenase AlkB family protein n=1 Tax=uncultured Chryseobacterium sp. TaxID=259322 RepID=UPI002614D2A2|nr:alpha-ketoglutarate-dependent dioxygenase AlkB [uncultured Chryseobacterium sp.]
MELFENIFDAEQNLLPKDGTVNYYGKVYKRDEADKFYQYLLNEIPWKADEAMIFGKLIETKRKVAWFGDDHFEYTYSGRTKNALKWTPELLMLKKKCEEITGEQFNSCLLNLYHDGNEGMAYHSDGEKDLKKNGAIASLTFGAERKFSFKHKVSKEKVELVLNHGSLLVMKDQTQSYWLHRLPPTKKVFTPRINLTFRTIVNHSKENHREK